MEIEFHGGHGGGGLRRMLRRIESFVRTHSYKLTQLGNGAVPDSPAPSLARKKTATTAVRARSPSTTKVDYGRTPPKKNTLANIFNKRVTLPIHVVLPSGISSNDIKLLTTIFSLVVDTGLSAPLHLVYPHTFPFPAAYPSPVGLHVVDAVPAVETRVHYADTPVVFGHSAKILKLNLTPFVVAPLATPITVAVAPSDDSVVVETKKADETVADPDVIPVAKKEEPTEKGRSINVIAHNSIRGQFVQPKLNPAPLVTPSQAGRPVAFLLVEQSPAAGLAAVASKLTTADASNASYCPGNGLDSPAAGTASTETEKTRTACAETSSIRATSAETTTTTNRRCRQRSDRRVLI
ncbi:uncharacterized protein LOC124207773 [Daphnia pulex]|uniref:uncharacterized protein LOC124207773 n=1 Tax=Daphnia pulex TaxID=6669 RepID=UPI001EE136D5|nr:uncharacterized protein LOC124207773 [Daphnia pulex]